MLLNLVKEKVLELYPEATFSKKTLTAEEEMMVRWLGFTEYEFDRIVHPKFDFIIGMIPVEGLSRKYVVYIPTAGVKDEFQRQGIGTSIIGILGNALIELNHEPIITICDRSDDVGSDSVWSYIMKKFPNFIYDEI